MKRLLLWITAGVVAVVVAENVPPPNLLRLMYPGVALDRWPDGRLRQLVAVDAWSMRRGGLGEVRVSATAFYTTGHVDEALQASITRISAELSIVDAAGKETALVPEKKKWRWSSGSREATVKLPIDLPDGDYQLRARVKTPVGAETVDVALPLYAPARIHVLTDRPLYEPGNLVKFRAVVLRAHDLAPLDGRPGTFVVTDPSGEILLEEKAPAGAWGVVAGSFPLDREAPPGSWRVRWVSGNASEEIPFTVEPFTLPRFRVEASPLKPFYRAGESPRVTGRVIYSSGAPVAGAKLELDWQVAGEWPAPTEWISGAKPLLPKLVVADASGAFDLKLPVVPADLTGQATLIARIGATDAAGDRVESAAQVLFSKDAIAVTAVTELEGGLVDGFNNRVYLRVTTADGRVLSGKKIRVKRAWSQTDPGIETALDADGVGKLQLDPGPPVNVVIPPAPVRVTPRAQVVSRGEVEDLLSEDGAPLADQLVMDSWVAALEPCAKWTDETTEVDIGMRVDPSGAIGAVVGDADALARCVITTLEKRRLPSGNERLYGLTFTFTNPDLPKLNPTLDSLADLPEELEELLDEAANGTRDCLPDDLGESDDDALPRALTVRTRAKSKQVELRWVSDPQGGHARAAQSCAESRIRALTLEEEADADGLGLVRFTLEPPERVKAARPQATTMLGYELSITASDGETTIGDTQLRMSPGTVPPLRMRATPVLAPAKSLVAVELIRGPGFEQELPKKLSLKHLHGEIEATLDPQTRTASFQLDDKAIGWCEVAWYGARALIYVRPEGQLSLELAAAQPRYAPGQTAEINVTTKIGGAGGPAAVGLFGVDNSLSQLTALAGADDMAKLTPQVTMASQAFGVLDGQALVLGRIRGEHAAAAVIARVAAIPTPPELDAVTGGSAQSHLDPNEELTDHFYDVLGELGELAHKWEAETAADVKMKPATMARMWNQALDAVAKRGGKDKIEDAYGRRLRLHRLPADLLALTDPRAVLVVGTRHEEDVVSWSAWVMKERP